MSDFFSALAEQRWDDHRYYHHSRINQSLHLFSSMCFVVMYVLLFTNPVIAAFLGWPIAMISRQIGHFFFEPKGYDEVNEATHEFKESVKVGYNLKRKVILLSIWALTPVVLYFEPSLFGVFEPHTNFDGYLLHLAKLWIVLGIGAVIFRSIHLFFLRDVQTGLVWFTKIITDPFHDIYIYHKAPLYLLRGELIAPRPEQHA